MRKFYTFLFITLLIAGCTSSRKYLQRAQFDAAINKSVQKLRKNPNNEKELAVLKEAYAKANQINTDRINFLKTSGEQNVWDEIYSNFNAMKYRQDQVKTLPDAAVSRLNIVFKNYDQEIIEAKKKAAEFYYNHAMELLKRNDRMSAREAF